MAAGKLHRLHRGVYAVGHAAVQFEGRCLGAVLALDPGATARSARLMAPAAVLSHRSAAELWGLMPRAEGPIHVTVPSGAGRGPRKGLIVHRSRTLTPVATTFNAGVRVTTPARTLTDLRPGLDEELHQRATRRALDLGLISRAPHIPDSALTRSELERAFLRLCRRHRLPRPRVNARVGPYEVDFLWLGEKLVVEVDGFEFHRSRDAFERDRARDADLLGRGFRVLRFTHKQLTGSRSCVARRVRELLAAA